MNKDYESLINYPNINEHIRSFIKEGEGFLSELYKECREEGLPVIKPETAALIRFILNIKKPCKILEIGTCVGYSALLMKEECKNSHITTIDRYDIMIKRAKENFEKYGEGRIELIQGDAADILPGLNGKYDFIFLDAAKGQYPRFLPHLKRLLENGGILMADNVLERGLCADIERAERRDRTIVRRLNEFLYEISNDKDFKTAILPMADGISLSYKTEE